MKNLKFKPLKWSYHDDDRWVAFSPGSNEWGNPGSFSIVFEQGKYWSTWSMSHAPEGVDLVRGYDTLEELQAIAQQLHNDYVKKFIEENLDFEGE